MACTIIGASGNAVLGGALIQLRALDWGAGAPVSAYPLLTVYHPSNGTLKSVVWYFEEGDVVL